MLLVEPHHESILHRLRSDVAGEENALKYHTSGQDIHISNIVGCLDLLVAFRARERTYFELVIKPLHIRILDALKAWEALHKTKATAVNIPRKYASEFSTLTSDDVGSVITERILKEGPVLALPKFFGLVVNWKASEFGFK